MSKKEGSPRLDCTVAGQRMGEVWCRRWVKMRGCSTDKRMEVKKGECRSDKGDMREDSRRDECSRPDRLHVRCRDT